MSRYYVTAQFVVEAEDQRAAELLVARRIQDMLGTSTVVCERRFPDGTVCGHENRRHGGHPSARVVLEAEASTDEQILRAGPPMLTEELGYVEVDGGEPIPGDGAGG